MTDATPKPRKRHIWWWTSLGLAAVVTVASFAAPSIVERLVLERLSAHAVDGTRLAVRRVGPFETLIEGVRIAGAVTVAADRVIVRYTPLAVFRGDLYSITLEGLAFAGSAREMALAAERIEHAMRTASGLRIAHVEFGEAKLSLSAPGGAWNASLRGALAQTPSGAFDGVISVVATSVAGAFGGEIVLAPDEAGRTAASLRLREAVVRLPGLTLESVAGEIAVARSDAPLPLVQVDLEMGGRTADGGGLERARLRLVSEGTAASASVAGIDLAGRRFTIESAAEVTAETDGIAFRLSRPGSFAFLGRPVRGAAPLSLEARIEPGDAPVARLMADADGIRIVHALRLALRPTTLVTALGPTRIEDGLLSLDGSLGPGGARGIAVLRVPRLAAADAGILADDLVLALHWEEGPLRFDLAAARVASTAAPAWFAPLPAAFAGTASATEIAFHGRLGGSAASATVEIDGEAALGGTGRAHLRLRPVELGALGRLSPALAGLADAASGQVAAKGEVAWGAGRLDGSARVLLRDAAGTLPFGRVERVNGVVALDRLVPPSTAGPQTLSVGAVEVGLPLTDGTVTFHLDGGVPTLAAARFALAGGLVTLAEATLAPALDGAALKLDAVGLDPTLLAAAGIEGIPATGPLSGSLAVEIGPERASSALRDGKAELVFSARRVRGEPAIGPLGADRHRIPEATRRQMEAYGEP